MGLFNFLYKLTNIFSNKRKLKVFLILVIILVIGFCWSRGVFAADANPQDTNALMNYQLCLQQSFVDYLRSMKKTNQVDDTNFRNLLSIFKNHHIYIVPGYEDNVQYDVYVYQTNIVIGSIHRNTADDFTLDGYWELGFVDGTSPTVYSGTRYPCKLGEFYGGHFQIFHYGTVSPNPSNGQWGFNFHIPDGCFMVRSHAISEFLNEFNVFNELPTTYNTHDSELQATTQSGFNNLNNTLKVQTQTMTNSISSATNSITNSVDNLTNTITDTTTDDTQVEFAQDTNQDLTSGFFTNLYNSFETAFVDTSYQYVNFPIPFTNKQFAFSSSYVLNNIKRNDKFSTLVTLAESFWWFALGYFVILDIYKKINAIKSGDLTNIENDNITTDLL